MEWKCSQCVHRKEKVMFFSTQCCGMAIDIVILILTLVEQNVWIHSRKMFISIILESIMCLYLDMASVFGIMYADKLPIYVTEFFCKAYLSSLVAAAFCGCLYVNAEYEKYNQEKQCGKFIVPTLWLLFFCRYRSSIPFSDILSL